MPGALAGAAVYAVAGGIGSTDCTDRGATPAPVYKHGALPRPRPIPTPRSCFCFSFHFIRNQHTFSASGISSRFIFHPTSSVVKRHPETKHQFNPPTHQQSPCLPRRPKALLPPRPSPPALTPATRYVRSFPAVWESPQGLTGCRT